LSFVDTGKLSISTTVQRVFDKAHTAVDSRGGPERSSELFLSLCSRDPLCKSGFPSSFPQSPESPGVWRFRYLFLSSSPSVTDPARTAFENLPVGHSVASSMSLFAGGYELSLSGLSVDDALSIPICPFLYATPLCSPAPHDDAIMSRRGFP